MNEINLGTELRNIREVLDRNPESTLEEVQQQLVEMPDSGFSAPSDTEGWQAERSIAEPLMHILANKRGHVTNEDGESEKTWSLTPAGEDELD